MGKSSVDLAALMKSAVEGDKEAYRLLLRTLQPVIAAYVKRRVADPEAAEDICQDIMLRIHGYKHTFTGKKLEPWIFTIAKNTIIDFYRARGTYQGAIVLSDTTEETAGSDADAEAKMKLDQAMSELSEDQREALTLVKVEGLTMEEGAERTGTSVSAFKVRAHRAYKNFKENFRGTG